MDVHAGGSADLRHEDARGLVHRYATEADSRGPRTAQVSAQRNLERRQLRRILLDREDRSRPARLVRNRSSGSADETPPPSHRHHIASTSRIRRVTTGAPDPLDLHHEDAERVIGVYLLETEDGLVLQDCGPSTCIRKLKEQLA